MTRQTGALVVLVAAVSFLLGLVASSSRTSGAPVPVRSNLDRTEPLHVTSPVREPVSAAAPASPRNGVDFAEVAARLNASVVNVDNASRGGDDRTRGFPQRYRRDFSDDSGSPREGSGSGFIVDPAGYILTNYHVIEGADRLTITLSDGRAFRAEVVGIDPAIDVALLKIDARGPLPVAPLGDSTSLRVGEWVCAIGNPLGYVHSVTVGVVSFIGRKVFDQSLDALIQTDAAITFGNSGGPLINSQGQVVGMTTAISALASNIGFAIPINQIVGVLSQLKDTGRVARGYVGVGLTAVTPALQSALRLGPSRGALVQDVTPGTPADRAGLRAYDVVLEVDGREMATDEDLIRYISGLQPGTVSNLEVWRDGASRMIPVKLSERPLSDPPRNRNAAPQNVRPVMGQDGPLGFVVRDLDPPTVARLRIPDTVQGVLVSRVDPAGPARLARLVEGHIVLEVNRQRTASVAEFRAVTSALQPGQAAAVLIYDRSSDQRVIATILLDAIR